MALPRPADASTDARIATMEAGTARLQSADQALAERVDRLAITVAALSGEQLAAETQARDLLLLAAIRRRFESGRSLGALEASVESRIAPRDPGAAAAILAWNAAPVTPRSLAVRLPTPTEPAARGRPDGWWEALRGRLSGLVDVRPVAGRTAADGEAAIAAALARGDPAAAIERVARLPSSPERRAWLDDAERWVAAARALDRLEEALLTAMPPSVAPASPPAR
jgi:hypothetical protein